MTPLKVLQGRVSISDLSRHYRKAAGGLDKITLTIAAGETVGFVGQFGAGKSTLVKLLLRFYDAEQGVIAIDGQGIGQNCHCHRAPSLYHCIDGSDHRDG